MEKQSPVQRIWELGEAQHGKLITAVVMAAAGAICGMVPYFAAAKVIALLLEGAAELHAYTPWLAAALAGYLARRAGQRPPSLRPRRNITARSMPDPFSG